MKYHIFPRKKDDKWIYYAIVILSLFSVIMVASASVGITSLQADAVVVNMLKQLIYFIIGYLLMMFFYYNFSLTKGGYLLKFIGFLLTVALFSCILFGKINGAAAWIRIGDFTIQPSEFVKTYVIIYCAYFFPRFYRSNRSLGEIIGFPATIMIIWLVDIVFIQNDFGTAFIIVLILASCLLLIQGNKFRFIKAGARFVFFFFFFTIFFILSPLGLAFISVLPMGEYQKQRFYTVLNPFKDTRNYSYQIYQSLLALAKSNIFGVGFGNSIQKFGYLPEARTDFIFPIIIEELGIFGLAIIIGGYGVIIYRMLYIALKIKIDNQGDKIILCGTVAYLMIHFFLNVGGVSALLPLTGVPLLLISVGGTSTICIMSLLGICLNIINKNKEVLDEGD